MHSLRRQGSRSQARKPGSYPASRRLLPDGKSIMQVKQRQTPRSPKASKKIAEAQAELADAKAEVAELEKPKWYIYDRNDLPDYSGYGDNADRMKAIGEVFPVIFFFPSGGTDQSYDDDPYGRRAEDSDRNIKSAWIRETFDSREIFGICVSGDPSWKRGRYFYRGEDISVYYHQCIRDNV